MRFFTLALLLACAAPAAAGDDPAVLPGLDEGLPAAEAGRKPDALQKPDARKIMAELSATLRLSSRQEERLSKAITKKSREFEENLERYAKNSAEERKWRAKMDENRLAMEKINTDMPDLIREYLDDEQRETYDNLLASRNKPREAAPELAPAAEGGEQPRKKRRLVRKKRRVPGAPAQPPAGPGVKPQPAPEEEAGGVMVDKEPAAPRKKRAPRRKAPSPEPAAGEPEPPAGAAPTGQAGPEDGEDAGSYP